MEMENLRVLIFFLKVRELSHQHITRLERENFKSEDKEEEIDISVKENINSKKILEQSKISIKQWKEQMYE